MTEIRANFSLNDEQDGSNLLQRLGELREVIQELENHQKSLNDMGYDVVVGETDTGELMVEISDTV